MNKAKKIIEEFGKKGWNLYGSASEEIPAEEVISKGNAVLLEMGVSYVLLPKAKDPKSPEQVFDALESLAIKLNREMPTITIFGTDLKITGITLRENTVKIHTPDGTEATYKNFIESIDSIVDAI